MNCPVLSLLHDSKEETKMSRNYPKFNRRHAGVMKWLFDHPAATLTECAKNIGYSRSWLSRIVNSPEFRAEFSKQLDTELKKALRRRSGQPL
jgi:DNA-binding MarR family transcriptional regulator